MSRTRRLDAPLDDRCRDYWVRDLPRNMPRDYVPRIQVPRGMEEDLELISALTLKVLQDNYGKNVLRNVLYNRVSDREFDNEDWDGLVASVMECYGMFMETRRRERPEELAMEAAIRVVEFCSSLQLEQFRELDREIDDRLYNDVKDSIRDGLDLAQDIDDWKRGGSRGHRDSRGRSDTRDDRYDNRSRGSGRRGYQGNGTADYDQGSGRRGEPREEKHGYGGLAGSANGGLAALGRKLGSEAEEERPRRSERFSGGMARNAMTGVKLDESNDLPSMDEDELHIGSAGARYTAKAEPTTSRLMSRMQQEKQQPVQETKGGDSLFPERRRGGNVITTQKEEPKKNAILPEIQNTEERPCDRFDLEDGRVAVLAHLTTLRKTYKFGEPEHLVYNSLTHAHYFVIDEQGEVSNLYLPLDDSMDYIRLENDDRMRTPFDRENNIPRKEVNYDLLANMVPKGNSYMVSAPLVSEEEKKRLAEENDGLALDTFGFENASNVTTPVMAMSLSHGIAIHEAGVALDDEDNGVAEYYIDLVTPFISASSFAEKLVDVVGSAKLEEAIEKFGALRSDESMPASAWNVMHAQLTERFMSFLNNELSIGVRFDSIVYDWEDVSTGIEKHYGAKVLTLINDSVKRIFGAIIEPLVGEDLTTFADAFCEVAEGKQLTAVCRRTSVTYMPWAARDMGNGLAKGGVVLESSAPDLYKAFIRLLERTEAAEGSFANVLVVATDGTVFDLRRGAFNSTHLMLVQQKADILR